MDTKVVEVERQAGGRFAKGHRQIGHAPKGPRKPALLLKEAILLAAEQVGFDGEGKDGLVGYLKRLAIHEAPCFAALLGKVLPTQVALDTNKPVTMIVSSMPVQEAAAAYAEMLKMCPVDGSGYDASGALQIDHDPSETLQ